MNGHRILVLAPPDDDGVASWSCLCGASGRVNDYDAEYKALKAGQEHLEEVAS